MVANYDLERHTGSREVRFAGDRVLLVGQIDYPTTPQPQDGYPLVVVLHHAGGNVRADYHAYAQLALDSGCAVFRWDKRGAGLSGASGRGNPLNDVLNAYRVALSQADINPERVVLLAHSDGTRLMGEAFDALCAVQTPHTVVMIANLLDKHAILSIKTRVRILIGEKDWISSDTYGTQACDAHNSAYPHGAQCHIAQNADRALKDTRSPDTRLHADAKRILKDWLTHLD